MIDAEDTTNDADDLLAPCSDHYCIMRPPGERGRGMGTNGGCEHLKARGPYLNLLLRALASGLHEAAAGGRGMTKKPTYAALVKLLGEAYCALDEELYAAGADEVKYHPVLQSHKRTFDKIRKALDAVNQSKASK